MATGGDSLTRSYGFESQHRILDGHFSHIIVLKIIMFISKDQKIKEAKDGQFNIFLNFVFVFFKLTKPGLFLYIFVPLRFNYKLKNVNIVLGI